MTAATTSQDSQTVSAVVTAPTVRRGIERMRQQAIRTGQLAEPVRIDVNPDKTLAAVYIAMRGSGTDDASYAALSTRAGAGPKGDKPRKCGATRTS